MIGHQTKTKAKIFMFSRFHLQVCLWDADDIKHISNFFPGIADWTTLIECCHVLDNVMPSSKHRPSDLVSILRGEVEMRFLLSFDTVTFTGICKLCALSYMVIQRMLHMPLVKMMILITWNIDLTAQLWYIWCLKTWTWITHIIFIIFRIITFFFNISDKGSSLLARGVPPERFGTVFPIRFQLPSATMKMTPISWNSGLLWRATFTSSTSLTRYDMRVQHYYKCADLVV